MHVGLTVIALIFAGWKGDWRRWEKYALTISYVIICNLLYYFLCHEYLLWEYRVERFPNNQVAVDLLYTFLVLPAITLVFLSNFPSSQLILRKIKYISYWVVGSMVIEFPVYKFGRLIMHNGYEYWMDFFFYMLMYTMIRLHYRSPIFAYSASIPIILFLLWFFQVPIK
jgi:hypothetical protein